MVLRKVEVKNHKRSTTMKSFLTGVATGLAIGYLTAPRSGKELRQQLTDTANQQLNGLKDQWNKTVSQTRQLAKNAGSSPNTNSSRPEPNLFADMQAGKLDKYLDDPRGYKKWGEGTNPAQPEGTSVIAEG